MKTKELKNLAKKIAKYERTFREITNKEEMQDLQEEIMKLCSSVHSLEDMTLIDEYVQDILSKEES